MCNFTKNGARVRPIWRSAVKSFSKVAGQYYIPTILLKIDSTTALFRHGWYNIFFKILGKFFGRYLCHSFPDNVAGLQSVGCNYTENDLFDKSILNQLLALKKIYIVFIWMPMPMSMLVLMPRFLYGLSKELFNRATPDECVSCFDCFCPQPLILPFYREKIRSNFFCKTMPRFTNCYKGFEWHKRADQMTFIVLPFWIHIGQVYFYYLHKTHKWK